MIKTQSITKKEFDFLILKSISNKHIIPDTVYYDNNYLSQLEIELQKRKLLENFSKRELHGKNGKIKMCSAASSSRLCFLYFANKEDITFEYSLKTGTRGIAQLDAAYKDKIFYECKCHEIFDKHDYLRPSYKKLLEKYFNISISIHNKNFCELFLKDFMIQDSDQKSIYNLHFDMKQLLCHLFGLANNTGGTLQYIFFTPSKKIIENNEACQNFYKELNEEIEMIWSSKVIVKMIQENNITLPKPKMIDISKIDDFIM